MIIGMAARTKPKSSTHPGSFVKSEVIEAYELSVTEAASVLGVTRPALSKLLNGRAHLSSEMAVRIEKAFGISMASLMRMQGNFDIAEAKKRKGEINVLPFKGKAVTRSSQAGTRSKRA